MQRRAVVVVLPSQSKVFCTRCDTQIFPLSPICFSCNRPCEAIEDLEYFALFGVAPHWILDEVGLRQKFLQISALIHPDKFEAVGPPDSVYALCWTTLLNRAYQTLRDPEARTAYFLSLNGIDLGSQRSAVPTELAELYFEAQENGKESLAAFRSQLELLLANRQEEWRKLGEAWPRSQENALLECLVENVVETRYLQSMLKDVNQKVRGATQ